MPGPVIRSDIVEVYIFRRSVGDPSIHAIEFLQMRRAKGQLKGTWAPVMGHVEEGETATQAALREMQEESGYGSSRDVVAVWQLESLNTYFLANIDVIVMSPGFAVEVAGGSEPIMDDSHDAVRWIPRDRADRHFVWPGQRAAIQQIERDILSQAALGESVLKITI